MFQAKISGWRRLAANLLLLPGLTAVGAEMLHLLGSAAGQERMGASVRPMGQDPRFLVKRAKEALDRGAFDVAADLARQAQAEAVSRHIEWGLFEDSPESILKEVARSVGKKNRDKADKLTATARELLERPARTLEQRATNLDRARAMCEEALQLHGPYGTYHFGDRADKLIRDIDDQRAKLNLPPVRTEVRGDNRFESPGMPPVQRIDPATFQKGPPPLPKTTVTSVPPPPKVDNGLYQPPADWDKSDSRNGPYNATPVPNVAQAPRDQGMPAAGNNSGGPDGGVLSGGTVVGSTRPYTPNPNLRPMQPNLGFPPNYTTVQPNPIGSVPGVDLSPSVVMPGVSPQQANVPRPDDTPLVTLPTVPGQGLTVVAPNLNDPFKQTQATTDNGKPAVEPPMGIVPPANVSKPQVAGSLQQNPDRIKAIEMMQKASALAIGERYVEARQALTVAQALNAPFAPNEETPEQALQSLMAAAQQRINDMGREANACIQRKTAEDFVAADKLLTDAEVLANGLGLSALVIGEHRSMLRLASSKTTPAPMGSGSGKATVADDPLPANLADPGAELLRQAQIELKANQLNNARRLVAQVLNTNSQYKNAAQGLLRTIDAEETRLKEANARRSYAHGVEALQARDYQQALNVFKLIDPMLLLASQRPQLASQMALAAHNLETGSGKIAQAGQSASAPTSEKFGADSLVKQEEAMRELQFQKLRAEGLQLEASATARFGKGETDAAMQDLNAFVARVNASSIDPSKKALLTRPIESRLERLKVLKHQQEYLTREAKDLRDFRNQMSQDQLYKDSKKKQLVAAMKKFNELMDQGKYQEASKVALEHAHSRPGRSRRHGRHADVKDGLPAGQMGIDAQRG